MSEMRFDNRVAIVTGVGVGLGRSHALGLAARGAKVVVNDLDLAKDGTGSGSAAARAVVAEIRGSGGRAIANGADLSDARQVQNMVDQTLAGFGLVDLLVNNAGNLRDKSFAKMDPGVALHHEQLSPKTVRDRMAKIRDPAGVEPIENAFAQTRKYVRMAAARGLPLPWPEEERDG